MSIAWQAAQFLWFIHTTVIWLALL